VRTRVFSDIILSFNGARNTMFQAELAARFGKLGKVCRIRVNVSGDSLKSSSLSLSLSLSLEENRRREPTTIRIQRSALLERNRRMIAGSSSSSRI